MRPPNPRLALLASLRLLLLPIVSVWAQDGPCSVGRDPSVVCQLNSSQTMEYELRWTHSWQWFVLPTNNVAGVSVGLVFQRGANRHFPKMGFVAMASNSGVPPGTLSASSYDPLTYAHDDEIGARRKFISESHVDGLRPRTDWKVLTLGFDTNRTEEQADEVQVPLGQVLIGLRCQEDTWVIPHYPGCRVSLTATLLPFALRDNLTVVAPMARGDTHLYRVTVGDYDTLNISLTRDVHNTSHTPARGLVGAAMLQLNRWARPAPLDFAANLSRASPGTDLETSPGPRTAPPPPRQPDHRHPSQLRSATPVRHTSPPHQPQLQSLPCDPTFPC